MTHSVKLMGIVIGCDGYCDRLRVLESLLFKKRAC